MKAVIEGVSVQFVVQLLAERDRLRPVRGQKHSREGYKIINADVIGPNGRRTWIFALSWEDALARSKCWIKHGVSPELLAMGSE